MSDVRSQRKSEHERDKVFKFFLSIFAVIVVVGIGLVVLSKLSM